MIFKQLCFFTLFFVECQFNKSLLTSPKIYPEYYEFPTTTLTKNSVKLPTNTNDNDRLKTFWRRKGYSERNKPENTVFIWDHYCRYQQRRGDCKKPQQRFYYNLSLDQCGNFTYSGCKGNPNNFETLEECKQRCEGAAFAYIKPEDFTIACELQYESGICLGLIMRFYYDVNENKCSEFIYGGCGGNKNNFKYESDCMSFCSK